MKGPVTVSTLGVKDSSEPRLVGYRVKADHTQTRTTTFPPSLRSRSSAQRNERALASLGTESPVVEVLRSALRAAACTHPIGGDRLLIGSSPNGMVMLAHDQRRICTTPVGAHPATLVDAVLNRLTDAGSTPARSTNLRACNGIDGLVRRETR